MMSRMTIGLQFILSDRVRGRVLGRERGSEGVGGDSLQRGREEGI
jgi:hypothetical protein